jgi:transcription initiation factor TFIIB
MTPNSERIHDSQPVQHDDADESERTTSSERETPRETCPECGGRLADDPEHGERACVECGLIVDVEEIDRGAEWTAYTAEERDEKSRVGSPTTPTMHDKGLSTEIDWRDQDARGNQLSARQRQKMSRLRMWHSRSQTEGAQDRNLRHGLGEIDRMASALGLPQSVRETASVIFRRVIADNLLIGRSIEGVSGAALYAAMRQSEPVRSLDEIAAVARIDKQTIARAYRYIGRELSLESEPPDPKDHLPRFCSQLNLSTETEHASRELLETAVEVEENYLSGKNPVGLAAAAVYAGGLLSNEKVTQGAVSDATNISEVTIRNRYQELLALHESVESSES